MSEPEVTASRVVELASAWLGTPYRHQASLRGVGCDCLGLVRGVWRGLYGSEPEAVAPYTRDWAEAGGRDLMMEAASRHFRRADEVRSGRLLLFRWRPGLPAKHAGIALDTAHFIHAYEGHSVLVSPLVPQWRRRIAAIFDFPAL